MMKIEIDQSVCVRCGKCVRVCPSRVFGQEGKGGGEVRVAAPGGCIVCGHCVGVCAEGAVVHGEFPRERVHAFSYGDYPTPEQMLLVCRARRSNRAFSARQVPREWLERIVEAAHRAPTATNAQNVAFTVVTDPERLRAVTEFTLEVFRGALKKLKHPLLRPLIRAAKPEMLRYVPVFERLLRGYYEEGYDGILRGATAVVFIHTPRESRFGCQDANLAYQNGSLMAECLGVGQFYTGFVCSAAEQAGQGALEKLLGIGGRIHAGMALGMPAFRFANYVDRKDLEVAWMTGM